MVRPRHLVLAERSGPVVRETRGCGSGNRVPQNEMAIKSVEQHRCFSALEGLNKMTYSPPVFHGSAFNRPMCGAYSSMGWSRLKAGYDDTDIWRSVCRHCHRVSYWYRNSVNENDSARLVIPDGATAPMPHPEMPESVRSDYEEARAIVDRSPRAAAALLRLAVQKLCAQLGESGDNLNQDIANLVRKGLPIEIQKALDVIRVVGNHSVHPGQLHPDDVAEVALSLFELINEIVDEMISKPKKLQLLFERLPKRDRDSIARRDKGAASD
jgi:hypothetical protein